MVKQSESMATKGLIGLQRVDLIREVVFESKNYDWEQVVNEVLPSICKGNARIPIFHFINQAGLISRDGTLIPDAKLSGGVVGRFDTDFESFRSQGGDLNR